MNDRHETIDLGGIARRAMLARGLEPDFPPTAVAQLKAIPGPAREADPSIRDLRSLLWCSIDNDSSMDLDQLTVAEPLAGGVVKVLVAIADVDALVKQDTPLDRHAFANTVSVYTAATVFAMLPDRLSTDLTSLGEGEDRLALVVEMTVAADGTVTGSDVYRGLVKNHAKLAYRGVAAWLEGGASPLEQVAKTEGLADQLRAQDRVAAALRAVRHRHGALDLETIEPETVVRNGAIVDVRADRPNRAKRLIEDLMIAANGVVARFLADRRQPTLLRVIRTPERWDRIREVAVGFGVVLPEAPDAAALSAFLTRRREADPLRFPDLSLAVVKLLGAGEYVVRPPGGEAGGHFGLAVREYSHSTAPNRRFPDLVTQRLLKAALAVTPDPYSPAELTALAAHCTEREDAAKKVERQVRKSAAALFLSGQVGETFDALVTGSSEKGTWVRALRPPVEGRLMDPDARTRVGDPMRVRLRSLDVERGFIDFVRA